MSPRSALRLMSARSRRKVIVGAATAALAIAIGGGTSSAMAATDLGCLPFTNGQLCATDLGTPGSVSATANFNDGSQQTIEEFPTDTWNALVQAQAQAPSSAYGMSALDYVLAHPPSSGSAGGDALLVPGLTGDVVGSAGAINDITPPGTTSHYDPLSGTTGTLVDGNLTNG
jgi:hypothetical protein